MLFWFLVVGMHVFWGYFHVPAAWAVRRLQTVLDSFRKSFQEPCELKMEIPAIQFYLREGVFFLLSLFVCFFLFLFPQSFAILHQLCYAGLGSNELPSY